MRCSTSVTGSGDAVLTDTQRRRVAAVLAGYGVRAARSAQLRATWSKALRDPAMAAEAGASAAIALGQAPVETLNAFVEACRVHQIDAMVDMMNVPYPLTVLRQMKAVPPVVIIHRGVDEERDNREKLIPFHEIQRTKVAKATQTARARTGRFHILRCFAGLYARWATCTQSEQARRSETISDEGV